MILCLVLLARAPFLHQAIQGDDFYYLKGAEHALIDPLHPGHARYVFQGQLVDMRGHPHPPLNAAWLGALVWAFGGEPEIGLHAAYILFSLGAAAAALAIARRFTERAYWATALFLLTPAFVVNGNSLEADLPFAACWLASIAFFVYGRWWLAAAVGALAGLAAYQAVILTPVLGWLVWRKHRNQPGAWAAMLAAPAAIGVWSLFERLSSGALPATVLAGYMQTYNLQAAAKKLQNAGALTGHLAWLAGPALAAAAFWRGPRWARFAAVAVALAAAVADRNPLFWISCGIGVLVLIASLRALDDFLGWWIAVFFAGALVIFFAGSQRYLLPIVLPVAILVSRRLDGRWLGWGAAAQALVSFGLALVNYQHWDGYRQFARSLAPEIARHRTWTNAEWGFRHYLEAEGAAPLVDGRGMWSGDLLITSAYAAPPQAGPSAVIASRAITSPIPLRIAAPGVDSAYSSISFGLAPFGVSTAPMDRVNAVLISAVKAELATLTIGTPEAASQIIAGVFNNDRWMSERATVVLKRPPTATRLEARIFIPAAAPARTVKLYAGDRLVAEQTYPGPGAYTIEGPAPEGDPLTAAVVVDRTFSVPPDTRQLGVLLLSVGVR